MAVGKTGEIVISGSKGMTLKLVWSEEYDVATNLRTVSVDEMYVKSEWYATSYFLNGSIKIAGVTAVTFDSHSGSHYVFVGETGKYWAAEASSEDYAAAPWKVNGIGSEQDGSKSVSITVDVTGFTMNGENGNGWTVSGTRQVALTTIPRAATLDALTCDSGYFTGQLSYKYTPKSAEYFNRCVIALNVGGTLTNVRTINLGKKSATQQTGTVTLTSAELSAIYSRFPTGTKGTLRFTLLTYSDAGYSSQVGSEGYLEILLSIPNDSTTQASVSMTLTPVSNLGAAFSGLYIQGKSRVKAVLSATGKYGATIEAYSVKVDGKNYDSGDDYTSDYLAGYGDVTVYGYAKDSRGFISNTPQKISVIAYSNPKLLAVTGESEVVAARCDAAGNLSDTGTYLKIKAGRSYSPVEAGGVQKNFCKIRFRYKLATAASYSAWTDILPRNDLSSDEIITGALLGGTLSLQSSYLVQVEAIDDLISYAYTTITIPTEAVHTHRTRNAMGLGKYVEGENLLDVGWDAHFHGEVRIGEKGVTLKEYILAVISEGG